MMNCYFVFGNSSSGILEAGMAGKLSINVEIGKMEDFQVNLLLIFGTLRNNSEKLFLILRQL